MAVATIAGREVHVDDEGFMTEYGEWNEEVAAQLAANIGVELTDGAWKAIRFLREDYQAQGETPTLRRVTNVAGIATKELFGMFPKKPAKKMAKGGIVGKPARSYKDMKAGAGRRTRRERRRWVGGHGRSRARAVPPQRARARPVT